MFFAKLKARDVYANEKSSTAAVSLTKKVISNRVFGKLNLNKALVKP